MCALLLYLFMIIIFFVQALLIIRNTHLKELETIKTLLASWVEMLAEIKLLTKTSVLFKLLLFFLCVSVQNCRKRGKQCKSEEEKKL